MPYLANIYTCVIQVTMLAPSASAMISTSAPAFESVQILQPMGQALEVALVQRCLLVQRKAPALLEEPPWARSIEDVYSSSLSPGHTFFPMLSRELFAMWSWTAPEDWENPLSHSHKCDSMPTQMVRHNGCSGENRLELPGSVYALMRKKKRLHTLQHHWWEPRYLTLRRSRNLRCGYTSALLHLLKTSPPHHQRKPWRLCLYWHWTILRPFKTYYWG